MCAKKLEVYYFALCAKYQIKYCFLSYCVGSRCFGCLTSERKGAFRKKFLFFWHSITTIGTEIEQSAEYQTHLINVKKAFGFITKESMRKSLKDLSLGETNQTSPRVIKAMSNTDYKYYKWGNNQIITIQEKCMERLSPVYLWASRRKNGSIKEIIRKCCSISYQNLTA